MDNREAVNWLINISADIGKVEHSDLWHYERALTEIKDMLESIQPVATDTNVGDKISKFIDGLEEIFADLRERHVDDSVCGLCEYDGAYMGQSGDWCNECPGFDRDDCFKLSDKTRKEWTEEIVKALPTIQPEKAQLLKESTTSDLISRQQTFNALMDAVKSVGVLDADDIKTVFDALTSVQHEKAQLSKEGTTSDLISRQAAIDVIEDYPHGVWNVESMEDMVDKIKALPSVQPEPPIIKCKDCKWWKKQKDSEQGRCGLLEFYPTGGWYCANGARERRTDADD